MNVVHSFAKLVVASTAAYTVYNLHRFSNETMQNAILLKNALGLMKKTHDEMITDLDNLIQDIECASKETEDAIEASRVVLERHDADMQRLYDLRPSLRKFQ